MKSIVDLFNNLQQNSIPTKIISISGESGTGKSTLALQLVAFFLSESKPNCCIWIQASELFPSKRLRSLFQNDSKTISFLEKNIFITPVRHPFFSYEEQSEFLINLYSKDAVLPPHLKCMVIDNISHHLRYEISIYSDVNQKTKLLDRFFEDQLFPLLCFCQREDVYLLLIHEISYDPTSGQNRSFFHKLYDRINAINIELTNEWYKDKKNKFLKLYDPNTTNTQSFKYIIHQNGLLLLQPIL